MTTTLHQRNKRLKRKSRKLPLKLPNSILMQKSLPPRKKKTVRTQPALPSQNQVRRRMIRTKKSELNW